MSGSEHHHLLVMIEAAQRAGCTEAEIVRIVETELGQPREAKSSVSDDLRVIRRLLAGKKYPHAA